MTWIAWRMLIGNKAKYLGIVFGVMFASLLIAQQSSIFCGLMLMTTSQIQDVKGAGIWVMDNNVQFVDDIKPMRDEDLMRVRGVPGVEWAVRFYKGLGRARLESGNFQQIILLGVDDGTLVGAPQQMLVGSWDDLRRNDALIIDDAGYRQLWPNEPFQVGKTFEMNDRRGVIVGVCKASRTFQTFPIVYTRYTQAVQYTPGERKTMSFILAEPQPGVPVEQVCQQIHAQTGLKALTRHDFVWATIDYYLKRTGIPLNFGITVVLGVIVGTAISGQTFYLFTVENLKQFGALKAMGASNFRIVGMVLLQATQVGFIGYCLGVGGAAAFGHFSKFNAKLAFYMPWWILLLTGAIVLLIVMLASLLCVWKVVKVEPAIVFKG
ncbi:MAG: FtsX-like permease family protein [Pirellulales bacterium]|nr:FtsX-like permease family protein [Pirellulales bacterium]